MVPLATPFTCGVCVCVSFPASDADALCVERFLSLRLLIDICPNLEVSHLKFVWLLNNAVLVVPLETFWSSYFLDINSSRDFPGIPGALC